MTWDMTGSSVQQRRANKNQSSFTRHRHRYHLYVGQPDKPRPTKIKFHLKSPSSLPIWFGINMVLSWGYFRKTFTHPRNCFGMISYTLFMSSIIFFFQFLEEFWSYTCVKIKHPQKQHHWRQRKHNHPLLMFYFHEESVMKK